MHKGKIILVCGKIGSGKTTYANKVCKKLGAVNLNQDEITIAIFGSSFYIEHRGLYFKYTQKVCDWIFKKALEFAKVGVNIVIDNGFWSKKERDNLRCFFSDGGVVCELHYIDTPEKQRILNITKRNEEILGGKHDFYLMQDEEIYHFFEPPTDDEIDVKVGYGETCVTDRC